MHRINLNMFLMKENYLGMNPGSKTMQILMQNLWDHADLACEFLTSLLVSGTHKEECPNSVGWSE
jgi:hypothetical protein